MAAHLDQPEIPRGEKDDDRQGGRDDKDPTASEGADDDD